MVEGVTPILLVDDDEDDFVITRDLLQEQENGPRYELEWRSSYAEGLAAMVEQRHAAYLVDYHIGPRTGLELLKEARARGALAPVIILTGQGDRGVDLEAMQAGAADYLEKGQLTPSLIERSIRYAVERRRAEHELAVSQAERQRLYGLFLQMPALVNVHVGPEHVFDLVHPSTRELLGREVRGLPVREALRELEGQGYFELLDRVYHERQPLSRHAMPLRVRTEGGQLQERVFDLTVQPWRDPLRQVTGVITFAIDVTDQVQARQQLQEAVHIRDEFMAIASHELRTPLTPLQLRLENAERAVRGCPEAAERAGRQLAEAKRHVQRLRKLMESLLDVTRIARGRLELEVERFDLRELLAELVERLQPDAAKARSTLSFEPAPATPGAWDRLRVEQILWNLLSNALKYGAGKPVTVRLCPGDETVRVEVVDHGIGIDPQATARIFERFERAVPTRNYGGLGLGLYIASQIAQAHGGTIQVASRPGEGSAFTVVLPRDCRSRPVQSGEDRAELDVCSPPGMSGT